MNWGKDDLFICEICYIKYGFTTRLADVHHIESRGMGGSKERDNPENLIGVCRIHHNYCHADPPEQKISKNEQREIHRRFTKWIKEGF